MKTISYEELKPRLDAGEKINLVDVREPAEHAEYNIGGILIPLGKVQTMQIEEIEDFSIPKWHKEQTLHRIKTSKQADFIPWGKAKKQLKSK